MLNVGIIGFGRIGQLHARTVQHSPLMRLVAIADPVHQQTMGLQQDSVRFFEQPNELLDAADVDAVIICSPSTSHAALTRYALQRRKHVFCEKPLALTEADISAIGELAERQACLVQVGFNRRFDRDFSACQQAIAAGEVGRPYCVKITSFDPAPPPLDYIKQSGGLLQDMAIHDFDMARFLMADEVETVYCNAAALHDPAIADAGDVDTVITSLRFKSGVLGVICNSRQCAFGYDQRVEVLGSLGGMVVENPILHHVVRRDSMSQHSAPLHDFFMTRYQQAYQTELETFCDAVLTGSRVAVGVDDALQALRLAKAAYASLQANQPMTLTHEVMNEYTL